MQRAIFPMKARHFPLIEGFADSQETGRVAKEFSSIDRIGPGAILRALPAETRFLMTTGD
jgi:hypothetical protein